MYDVLVRGGTVYDGTGAPPRRADVAVVGDRIVRVEPLEDEAAQVRIDATGRAVAPGFINILSHSYFSVLRDPRSLGELMQGVTTQLFGEGESMGPLTAALRDELQRECAHLDIEVSWTRLSEYLAHVERAGCAQNVASLVGAATIRAHVVGYDDRPATADELATMQALLAEEMADGALGVGSSLIYAPGSYAPTDELVALATTAARYGGIYASHIRHEGSDLLGAVEELLTICREADCPTEQWHLKAAGRENWGLMNQALERLEAARGSGLPVTADVYPYTASGTGLASTIPANYHAGGPEALFDRLHDPATRAAIRGDLVALGRWGDTTDPSDVVVLGLRRPENRRFQGTTLESIAAQTGADPVDVTLDLVASERTSVFTAFHSMSADNLRKQLTHPWVGICSDAASMAPEGAFLATPTHPRAYGAFARVLGRIVRDDGLLTLTDAVRRMSGLPASTLGLTDRGRLAEGYAADIVVFDPDTVVDRATFADPHQLAVGVNDVVVNGQPTVSNGIFTGRLAGRALRGARGRG